MKKMLLAAISMTGLLASCGGGFISAPVDVTAVNGFTSNWTRTNSQGQQEYIICDDRDTTVTMDVSWTGPLAKLDAYFDGAQGTRFPEGKLQTTGWFAPDTSGRDTFTYTFGPGMAPLKTSSGVKAQAIVINPVQKGTTFVTVTGYNPDGQADSVQAPGGIPVYDCGAL
ncbi:MULTISPECIES: hypothetical protein [Deinococcus]|jgi:hypothetical protein|uniref:Lipoprotein n=2 Tax=Deinococcus TaxID=1298 RepID=A0A221SWL0_9DEIO|nr:MULTISPECIES: hypothetical protein [Deinococcus]ASN81037.1 hypothetical protein DFI_08525 [Deinococcus ficus]MDP9763072.1 hypothetical protein [Deinococcus enclensis]